MARSATSAAQNASSYGSDPRGTVSSEWRRTADGLVLDVVVPANARGRVFVPASDRDAVWEAGSGTKQVAHRAPGVNLVGREGDRVVYEVGSGHYQFLMTHGGRAE